MINSRIVSDLDRIAMIIQSQTQSLRPLTTAHLAQTMTLLELNNDLLCQKIEAELAGNPALEIVDEHHCPGCGRPQVNPGLCPLCSLPTGFHSSESIIFVSPYTDFQFNGSPVTAEEPPEEWNSLPEDLPTFILRQIAPELNHADRPIAAHILTSLDEDGLLRISWAEIARYHHVPLSRIERVIRLIQKAEPIGSASANPQQALLIQLEVLAESNPQTELSHREFTLAQKAIQENLDLLSRRAYNELGRRLGINSQEAQKLANFIIENLNPYPARSHWGDNHQDSNSPSMYLNPDIVISYLNHENQNTLVVEILTPYAGSLRVNPLYKEAINQAPPERAESWQEHLDRALLLVKCMQQRNNTMVRLMEHLVRIQRQFIIEGDAHLVPITRAYLAQLLDVHESTVSRAVSGKAVQLPNKRIILLDKFFDRSLQVRAALCDIIATETRPLSDTELATKLVQLGYPVARRTVAKYRAMEGILPARFRHKDEQLIAQS